MAEQFLHRAQVGAALEQVGRERVAQSVRSQRGLQAGRARAIDHGLEHPTRTQRPPVAVEPQRARIERTRVAHQLLARRQPRGDRLARRAAEQRQPFLLPFAEHPHDAFVEIERLDRHAGALGDTAAGRVEHFEDRAIARTLRRFVERLRQQQVDFAGGEEARHARRGLRALQQLRRILADAAFLLQPRKQPAQAGELSLHRGRDEALLFEFDQIPPQMEARDGAELDRYRREPLRERAQVAAVGAQRRGALAPFAGEPVQVVGDHVVHGG
jgi:hypothetical protein